MLIAIQNEREWVEFCARFLDEPDLPRREGFQSNVVRVAHRAMVDAHIGEVFARLTRDQAAAKLRAANTAYGFVNDVAAFSHHPALRRAEVETPNGPVSLGRAAGAVQRRAADAGAGPRAGRALGADPGGVRRRLNPLGSAADQCQWRWCQSSSPQPPPMPIEKDGP